MTHKIKKIIDFLLTTFTIATLIFAAACSSSDDDDKENGSQGGESASGTGGDQADASSGSGGTGDNGTGGSGETGGIDAGDSNKTVEKDGICSLTGDLSSMQALGIDFGSTAMTGICQDPSDPCEGGTAEGVNIMGMTGTIDPEGNCVTGLVCCIGKDQCDSVKASITQGVEAIMQNSSPFDPSMTLGDFIESIFGTPFTMEMGCSSSCSGMMSIAMGCPSGETCCVETPFDTMFGDGGFQFPDGGIQ